MNINCLLVDDEPASREILEKYIRDCPFLHLSGSCKNAFEAAEQLNQSAVQLLFLDINMPKLSGLGFYKSLVNPPDVIFTTAYPEYAVEGFEVEAVDYLLKPFSFERFLKAVNKVQQKYQQNTKQEPASIILRADKKLHRVKTDTIYYLEALGDYVKVHCREKTVVVHTTLQNLLNDLPDDRMVRVHKSFAIARDKIEWIEGNQIHILDAKIPIGKRYKTVFMQAINDKH